MKANDAGRRRAKYWTTLVKSGRSAFIAGPILTVLFLCLFISLTLGEALGHAAAGTRREMDSLKAYLVFEETLLRLDLEMTAHLFTAGGFSIRAEEAVDPAGTAGIRVRLMDGPSVLEEAWLKRKE